MRDILTKHIAQAGPLSLDGFMQLCLHHPRHGYYTRGESFGREGDFITAPEISPLFALCVGHWVRAQWVALGKPAHWRLVELGPGRGALIAGLLPTLPIAPHALQFIEASPTLQNQVRAAIPSQTPAFFSDLGLLPESDLPTIFIGNEYLDALPIRQFTQRDGQVLEVCVGLNARQELEFQTRNTLVPATLPTLHDGEFAEVGTTARTQVKFMADEVRAHGGAALLIDYGYIAPPRTPTFQAIERHQMVSPLDNPGAADLTALVDFGALKDLLIHEGLEPRVDPQRDFLRRHGLGAFLDTHPLEAAAAARLIRPEAMGTLFQALSFFAPPLKRRP